MIGSPDLKWLGLAWFGGGSLGLGGVICRQALLLNSLCC